MLFLDGSPWIARCVDSLRRNIPAALPHELIILGNGIGAGAAPVAADERTRVLRSEVNLGFGGGCNWAARHARGEFLVFLNDDTEVQPGWLEALVAAADADPGVAAAGSLVLSADGRVQEAGRVLWRDGVSHGIASGLPAASARLEGIREVDYCSACSLLVRRSLWEAAGGFDGRYFPAYYEDSDLCLELRRRGGAVVCAAGSRLVHHRSVSTTPVWRRFLGLHHHRLFVEKWAAVLPQFPVRPRDEPTAEEVEAAARGAAERRRALYDAAAVEQHPPVAGAAATDRLALLQLEVAQLQAELRLKDEYIAHLGATAPEMERALARMLADERRRIRRRERIRRLPLVGGAAAWLRRRWAASARDHAG